MLGRESTAPDRKGFLFDPNKCTGCQACELACAIENELDGISWRQVSTLNEARRPGVPVIHLSLACNHCADPPCAAHCPALAYTQDPATGRVNLEPDHCIGCRYCSWACPYDAPKFHPPSGVMTKCTFCGHRQERGLEPACVALCPTGALGFGDLERLPGVPQAVGLPTVEPGPSIRFIPWRGNGVAERQDTEADGDGEAETPSKISMRSEWPLLGFTLAAAVAVAMYVAVVAGSSSLPALAFLAPAVLGMGLSTFHLGRKLRAWRAVLNVRRSWLSREVVLFSAFVGLAALQTVVVPGSAALAYAAALLGFAGLFAMDRVYDVVRTAAARPVHSADVLLTALLVAGLLVGSLPLAGFVAFVKLALYLRRPRRFAPWGLVRVGCGFVFPLVMGLADPERWPAWALAGTAAGELVDRGEFYGELEVPTPRRQMAAELEQRLSGGRALGS